MSMSLCTMFFLMFFFVPCTTGIPLWNIFIYTHFYTKWIFHCWVGLKNQPGAFEAKFRPTYVWFLKTYTSITGLKSPLAKQNQDISRQGTLLFEQKTDSYYGHWHFSFGFQRQILAGCWGPNPRRNCCFSNPHVFLVSSVHKNSPQLPSIHGVFHQIVFKPYPSISCNPVMSSLSRMTPGQIK